jgi:hypothetical protein
MNKVLPHAHRWTAALLGLLVCGAPGQASAASSSGPVLRTANLTIELAEDGSIAGARIGKARARRALRGGTELPGCRLVAPVVSRALRGGGYEFQKRLRGEADGRGCVLVERFVPTPSSIRWELELRADGAPWSTNIVTRLAWPDPGDASLWTAWDDPDQQPDRWRDPLVWRPFAGRCLWYGAPHWDEAQPGAGYVPGRGDRFVIPLLTVAEPAEDLGLSLVLSPEDTLLELVLRTTAEGALAWERKDHRLVVGRPVRFALDLVAHEADWRGGLRWMVHRYAPYFDPPNPRAHAVAGLGAYSAWEGALDAPKLNAMGFKVNWKASYDFPYMGMFLPPIGTEEPYPRFVKGSATSARQMADYSIQMHQMGFYVLNYFNVTEFGGTTGMPTAADPALPRRDRWRNVHNFLQQEVADGILRDRQGRVYPSWEGCIAMDCGGPRYRAFLLQQARRHLERLPASAGICIDRLDWLRYLNFEADDGLSWRGGVPCRSLYVSWRGLMEDLGPLFHGSDKVIFANAMINRTELLRHVDGIYHEFGHVGDDLNGAALQCVRKPCLAWTPDEKALQPDPDAYFQRHLYLGAFPTAPLPGNDHTIQPSEWADRQYLDYGPLFVALQGRQWVLEPHPLAVSPSDVKANLFTTPSGHVIPVTFGAHSARLRVALSALGAGPRRRFLSDVLHPGSPRWKPLAPRVRGESLSLDVPLERGCALVRLHPAR